MEMNMGSKLPKLIVFDLDYTLWPFWLDTHVTPPFSKKKGTIVDLNGKHIKSYPEVPQVLEYLKKQNCSLAVASRTSEIEGANQLLDLFGWDKYFIYKEIYPGSKRAHFQKFKEYSNIDYSDMLFFDDENRNIRDLSAWNVTCILVKDGMTMKVLEYGLKEYATSH